jgi:peptide/nickel transport system substrate-binding protein
MFTNYWFQSDKGGLAGNRSFYSNPRMDQWLAEAAASSDPDRRMALYKQVQKQAIKDAVYVYLYQDNYLVGLRKDIKGFVYNPMLDDVFNVADIRK